MQFFLTSMKSPSTSSTRLPRSSALTSFVPILERPREARILVMQLASKQLLFYPQVVHREAKREKNLAFLLYHQILLASRDFLIVSVAFKGNAGRALSLTKSSCLLKILCGSFSFCGWSQEVRTFAKYGPFLNLYIYLLCMYVQVSK